MLDKNKYQNGVEVTKEEVKELRTIFNEFHREWDYTFKFKKKEAA
ncbi:MAG: hypothetical protein QG610_1630 [Euryarchaeota archaeon]|nr:hypothetical protein [Euryarchaeota archaeon]